jgi:hypothetical protein
MRRGIVFAAALAVALAAVSPDGLARTSRRDVIGVCDVTDVDIHFWPHGHEAREHAGNPLGTLGPHVEFYRAADPTVQLGYMETRQNLISSAWCAGAGNPGRTVPLPGGVTPQTTDQTQKLRCSFEGKVELRIAPFNKVTKRIVTRLVKINGKRRSVRKTITRTTRMGNRASISTPEDRGAVAVITLASDLGTPSLLKWDPRVCKPVDVTG